MRLKPMVSHYFHTFGGGECESLNPEPVIIRVAYSRFGCFGHGEDPDLCSNPFALARVEGWAEGRKSLSVQAKAKVAHRIFLRRWSRPRSSFWRRYVVNTHAQPYGVTVELHRRSFFFG